MHNNELSCLLGFRSNAAATELYDEARLRHDAVAGVLHALSGAADLNTLENHLLQDCILAMRLLCSDAAALYSAAWKKQQAGHPSHQQS
nr:hypothetical protein [Pseudomonas insulae]